MSLRHILTCVIAFIVSDIAWHYYFWLIGNDKICLQCFIGIGKTDIFVNNYTRKTESLVKVLTIKIIRYMLATTWGNLLE
ncbi:hypothetical protein ACJX0J_011383, partial [Zea mays]